MAMEIRTDHGSDAGHDGSVRIGSVMIDLQSLTVPELATLHRELVAEVKRRDAQRRRATGGKG